MNRTQKLVLIALFTALIAVGAFIRIPIPLVPFTLQLQFVMLAGLLLGGRLGAVSVLCYVAMGLLGLPVFAGGGGIAYVLQPTFGYLIGFCVGAFVTGTMANRSDSPSLKRLLIAEHVGLCIIYACGMLYYWLIATFYTGTGIGFWTLFLHCFLLTVPGDVVLCFVAALMAKRIIPILRRRAQQD